MPATKRKGKTAVAAPTDNDAKEEKRAVLNAPDALPFTQYTSALAVHTTLLSFIAFFLPRTAFLSDLTRPIWDAAKQSSQDKPQHPFLDALTLSPVSTVAWICAGVVLVQVWWGGWVRAWYIGIVVQNQGGYEGEAGEGEGEGDSKSEGGEESRRMRRIKMQQQRFKHLKAACLATVIASLVFHIVLVLLGAPLSNCSAPFLSGPDCPSSDLHLRTYLLALLLALLTVSTPAYTLGIPNIFTNKNDSQVIVLRFLWTRLFAEFS
ncbi:hypothetical protein AX15_007046 [Amanita polypyramis BW_CC]|nr:hypothetical protein AX15_007046 [Amanita polypyramis BW_CC]